MPLPYSGATLSHDWHLDPKSIPVPTTSRSARAHVEEVRHRQALLTSEQRHDPAYATDSPNWASWFVFEHEEARRRDVREVDRTAPPPPLVVREEDQVAEGAGRRWPSKRRRHTRRPWRMPWSSPRRATASCRR
ncbi:hypothetical protein D1007_41506 [Hordeum vulgare]|nr:hypothetical protein D1007_41506 [Hordeum vulgare]